MTHQGAPSPEAVDLYADAIAAMGPAYANLAGSVRGGFVNTFVLPALRAIDAALDQGRPDPE